MKRLRLRLAAPLVLLVLAGFWTLQGWRHDLQQRREAADQAWLRVESALRRRMELLPALLQMLRPAASESAASRSLVSALDTLRSATEPQRQMEANAAVDAAMARVLLEADAPKAPPAARTFHQLEQELTAAEEQIAVARRRYNEALQKYNVAIDLFPGNVAAFVFGFRQDNRYFRPDAILDRLQGAGPGTPAPAGLQ